MCAAFGFKLVTNSRKMAKNKTTEAEQSQVCFLVAVTAVAVVVRNRKLNLKLA